MTIENTEITVVRGSLLEQPDLHVLVNANNCRMRDGGGINGMFHKACGPELLERLIENAPFGAPTASPVITLAPNLNADFIVHVAGPVWVENDPRVPEADREINLYWSYYNCVVTALDGFMCPELKRIGFPSLSTGIYGFPLDRAAPIAVQAVIDAVESLQDYKPAEIRFVMFAENEYEAFQKALTAAASQERP